MKNKIRCFGFQFKEVSTIRGHVDSAVSVDDTDKYEPDSFVIVHERARYEFAEKFFPQGQIPDNVYLYPDPGTTSAMDVAGRYPHRVKSGVENLPLTRP